MEEGNGNGREDDGGEREGEKRGDEGQGGEGEKARDNLLLP